MWTWTHTYWKKKNWVQYNIWHIICTSVLTASPVKITFFPLRTEGGECSDLERRKQKFFFQCLLSNLQHNHAKSPEFTLSIDNSGKSTCMHGVSTHISRNCPSTWYWLDPMVCAWEEQGITLKTKPCWSIYHVRIFLRKGFLFDRCHEIRAEARRQAQPHIFVCRVFGLL